MSTPAAALLHRRWIARFRCHVVARTLCRPGWPRNLPTTCKTRTRTPTTRPLRCGRDGSQATRRVSRRSTGRHRWTLTGCSPSSSARPWRRSGYRRAAPSAPNPTAPLPRPMSGVRLHDLRHTAAVLWLSARRAFHPGVEVAGAQQLRADADHLRRLHPRARDREPATRTGCGRGPDERHQPAPRRRRPLASPKTPPWRAGSARSGRTGPRGDCRCGCTICGTAPPWPG